jgi:hypothetical protein
MEKFKNMTWDDVRSLSITGKLGPHVGVSSALLLARIKPVWLTTKDVAENFYVHFGHLGFVIDIVPKLSLVPNFLTANYGVFHQENRASFEALCAAYELYQAGPISRHTLNCDIAVGLALGYNQNDIARFIIQNLSKEEFEIWASISRQEMK